jgi:hypothetical protein
MMPRAKTVILSKAPPVKGADHAEQRTFSALEKTAEDLSVNARGRYMAAHPIYGQHPQGKQDASPQLWNTEDVLDALDQFR